ncbi:MAG: hypothetical protein WC980_06445 [Candidatus Brocadiia bacterium]
MMNYVKTYQLGAWLCLLAVIVSAGAVYGQEGITINAAVQSRTLAQNQVKYFIIVDGAAGGLPAQAVLKINLYYAFPLKDDDPANNISIKNRSRILDTKRCRIKESKYVIDFGPYNNTPPPGSYYITVTSDNPETVTEHVLNLGGFQEANDYREKVLAEIRQQAFRIEPLFKDVKTFFLDNIAKPVSATSEADQKIAQQWLARITAITNEVSKTCGVYDEFRVFGVISTYKNTTTGLADSIKSLARVLVDALLMPPAERRIDILKEKIDSFRVGMEEDLSALGWIKPFNKELVAQTTKNIRSFLDDKNAVSIPAPVSKALLALGEELPPSYYNTISLLAANLAIWAKYKPTERTDYLKGVILDSVEVLECLLHDHSQENGEHNHEKEAEKK